MVKIATPISSLFKSTNDLEKVRAYSDCFELREHSPNFFSKKKFLYHFDIDLIHKWDIKQKTYILNEVEKQNNLKLISFQATRCYEKFTMKNNIFYPKGKKLLKEELLHNATVNVKWLKKKINNKIKIAIENNNYYPTKSYDHVTDTFFLNEIVLKNNIFLLLDIAHARITCINQDINFNDYLQMLPLSKIIQIHLCRHSTKSDLAYDSHFKPSSLDIKFCIKLSSRFTNIKYITIEYYKSFALLLKSLKQLRLEIKKS